MKKRSLGVVLTLVRVGAKGVALGLGQVLRQLGRAIAVEVRRARWPYRRPEMHDLLCHADDVVPRVLPRLDALAKLIVEQQIG